MSSEIELVVPTSDIKITKELGGVEDLLLDASDPKTVEQIRAGKVTTITKININTIPYKGKLGGDDFISVKEYIDSLGDDVELGGFILTVGDGGVKWSGGVPADNEIAMAQKQTDGTYRWLGKTTIGSDNWQFRGRVKGVDAVEPDEFITKRQGDDIYNRLHNEITVVDGKIPPDTEGKTPQELRDSNDTTSRIWSAQELKDFCPAPSSGPWGDCTDKAVIYNTFHYNNKSGVDRDDGWFGKKAYQHSLTMYTNLDNGWNYFEYMVFIPCDTDTFKLQIYQQQAYNLASQVLTVNGKVEVSGNNLSYIVWDKPIEAGTFIHFKGVTTNNMNIVKCNVKVTV